MERGKPTQQHAGGSSLHTDGISWSVMSVTELSYIQYFSRQKQSYAAPALHNVAESLEYAMYIGSFKTYTGFFSKILAVEAKLDTK